MIGLSPKIMSKIFCESRKSREPVKVITSLNNSMDLTLSIFEVNEVDDVYGKRD